VLLVVAELLVYIAISSTVQGIDNTYFSFVISCPAAVSVDSL